MPATESKLEIEDVKRLTLEPGDVLVIRVPAVTVEQAECIQEGLKPSFPDNLILVTEPGTELEVVGPGGEPPAGSRLDTPQLFARAEKSQNGAFAPHIRARP